MPYCYPPKKHSLTFSKRTCHCFTLATPATSLHGTPLGHGTLTESSRKKGRNGRHLNTEKLGWGDLGFQIEMLQQPESPAFHCVQLKEETWLLHAVEQGGRELDDLSRGSLSLQGSSLRS